MELEQKLSILADAAKYDASCASSGTDKRNSLNGKGIGSTEGSGICHSYAPDGRCISLLKILFTNFCTFDCLYCVNRVSSNVARARFTVDEVVRLTLDFYRRNCIEGLFLSSGIIRTPDYTMERVVEVARVLREEHDFRGYIHLKTIPEASPELLARAGLYADRLSINVELPSEQSLAALAPEKDGAAIRRSMARLRVHIDAAKDAGRPAPTTSQIMLPPRRARPPRFAPAGQSTQMIVGADATSDRTILASSALLYGSYRLKRVYYSAFSPIPDASRGLPLVAPPLLREHRLYQADWLMRFYGFAQDEIVASPNGMLSLEIDPKLAWALAHRERFPVDINRAAKELLLRVPGLGVKAVRRLLAARRVRRLRAADLERLHVPLGKVLPFVETVDHHPGRLLDSPALAQHFISASARARLGESRQGLLFAEARVEPAMAHPGLQESGVATHSAS
ncbi:MAG: putative DNA modification/repair radical SAM protein [Pseudomonadota bacterium]|nr:putative DNA modification/repair radical SAM protein [Pseudomonadota bacterium]